MRPGKPIDLLPLVYPNEEAAKAQFYGISPPDLTYIVLARKNGRNLLFSLLTGSMDPPAGVSLADYQHFNIYSPDFVTVMPPVRESPLLAQSYSPPPLAL